MDLSLSPDLGALQTCPQAGQGRGEPSFCSWHAGTLRVDLGHHGEVQATIPSVRQSNLGPQQTPSRLTGADPWREREKSIFKSPEAFYRPMLTGQLPAAQGEGGGAGLDRAYHLTQASDEALNGQ